MFTRHAAQPDHYRYDVSQLHPSLKWRLCQSRLMHCVLALFPAMWDMVEIKAMGRGAYQRSRTDSSGRVISLLTRKKAVHGFQTGDMVGVNVPTFRLLTALCRVSIISIAQLFNVQTVIGTICASSPY